jgi:phosphohistidine phosphatase
MVATPVHLRLVVFRHGPAEVRNPARWTRDDRRPLTAKGVSQTRRAARGLAHELGGVGLIASSSAVRAKDTAELLRAALSEPAEVEYWPELAPGRLAASVLDRIAEHADARETVVVVGHEPALAELVGIALTGESAPIVRLGKAGAVLVEFPASVRPGAGRLRWALTRKQLAARRA